MKTQKPLIVIVCFLIGLYNLPLFSQSIIRFNPIDDSKGLPSNGINSTTSDQLGFIWIGTTDGLCRYESENSVKIFKVDNPKIKGGLQSNTIKVLHTDSKGTLWIGTRYGGLTKYNQKQQKWTTYTHKEGDPTSISNNDILAIEEDSAGRMWIGTEDGLNVYHSESDSFTSFLRNKNDPSALQAKAILSISEDEKGWIWVGTWGGGLYLMLPPKDGSPLANTLFKHITLGENLSAQHIWAIYQDKSKRYWIGTFGDGLNLMHLPIDASNDKNQQDWLPTFQNFRRTDNDPTTLSHNSIKNIYQDTNQRLWVGTVEGLNYVDLDNLSTDKPVEDISALKFHRLYNESRNSQSLIHNEINLIYEDRQGLMWFSTYSGISQYNPQANQFSFINLLQTSVSNNYYNSFYINDNNIAWIGSGENGLILYDLSSKKTVSHSFKAIKNKYINSVYSPNKTQLYLGSRKGIFILDLLTQTSKEYPFPESINKKLGDLTINNFLKDSKNRLWLSSEKGLLKLDEKTGIYTAYVSNMDDPTSISDNSITSILEDANQSIWIGTFDGLNRVIKEGPDKKLTFKRFKNDLQDKSSIFSNRIVGLKNLDNIIYIATTNGLGSYDLETKEFINHSVSNFKYTIHAINITSNKVIWASTSNGILKFNPATKQFNEFVKKDGIEELTFGKGACGEDTNGNIYFGSKNGLTKFNPKNIKVNTTPPPVFVTTIKSINSEREYYSEAVYKDTLVLKSDNYYLSLDFAALNYNRSYKNIYAYKLIGLDEDWNYTSINPNATYTNLKPGSYTFKVKAANNNGIWNETGATLHIIRPAAFHETKWYLLSIIGSIVLFLSAIFAAYMNGKKEHYRTIETYNLQLQKEVIAKEKSQQALQEREKQLNKKNQELKRSNQELEQFAYIASHDLQSPLRTINSFSGLLEKSLGDKLTNQEADFLGFITTSIYNMQNLVDDLLTFSKLNATTRKIQSFDPNNLLASIQLDMDSHLKEKNTRISISDFPKAIHADKTQLKQLFQNLVSNGIKFTKQGISPHIKISCQEEKAFWEFCVADNGIGISEEYQDKIFKIFQRLHSNADYEGTGIGLAICKKIVDQHEGKIWINSEVDKGSKFFFTISKNLN